MPKRPRSTKWSDGPPAKRIKRDENIKVEWLLQHDNKPVLNDDCLQAIFEYLSVKDLFAVSECSQRLSALAESTVETRWRDRIRSGCAVSVDGDSGEDPLVLAKFGKLITHLSVTEFTFAQAFDASLSSALEFCTSLRTLNLKFLDISLIPFGILENIVELEMYGCSGDDWIHLKLIKFCTKLKHLKLMMDPKERLMAVINEHLSIESVYWEVFGATNSTFVNEVKMLAKMKKLKKLMVHGYEGYTFKGMSLSYRFPHVTETIKALAKSRSMEELDISYFDPDDYFFKALNKFAKLKRCTLSTYVEIPNTNITSATNFDIKKEAGSGLLQWKYIITPKQTI